MGFKSIDKKPDGWYLPNNTNNVAIVLEIKSENSNINKESHKKQLFANIDIISTKYKKTIGILYNGKEILVYKNKELIGCVNTLQNKKYYLNLFKEDRIDKNKIYSITRKINNLLHFQFGIKNLYYRMIFTAAALVAERFGGRLEDIKNNGFGPFRNKIYDTLNKSLEKHKKQNIKIDVLLEVYNQIKINIVETQEFIDLFIDCIVEISSSINSDNWNGEDVMGIFFNEFNRYKNKSENGQIFTPEHITSFMYDLIEVSWKDKVLDATCGSGAFLVKSMSNMIREVGGIQTKEAEEIKSKKLFGIELDREIFALACANMLIHKDGKTNLENLDTRTEEACEWIKSKKITKVLMNPPFERKYGCKKIVQNVLNNVPLGTMCAFILPDKKLEKEKMYGLLKEHTLEMIIKLPVNLFDAGITTSIFVFKTGIAQGDKKIFSFYIKDDGLERVKNQGRHDIKNKWNNIKKYWLNVARTKEDTEYNTHQWLEPNEMKLSYQLERPEFEIYEDNFKKTIIDYITYEQEVDIKEFNDKLLKEVLYNSDLQSDKLTLKLGFENEKDKY
ncbi:MULTISPECIES: class I SAM-dependent DNA methyltransferase [unclassified Mycoplasma]|uniref:HsdM family class I SAM-dependent methyltransferase n=1 Tax=unclassified Mycoplasma TaxID=2683645 RepID=UPI00211CBFC2|nr:MULTISPECIES: SAM-dependent methyltransferase [unclassified Mycoplasma]UUM19875.1 SAM-dependent methyltransferase [Mycoplasma sp. 1578d]UUM24859.1 SAM-dependent methyltransferase [Mycoplasma sp. 3686d]